MITKREYQITELIAWGASDKEVAQELEISFYTVRTHRKNILNKLGLYNSADLTRWFFQHKTKQCLGLNPRQVIHIAIIFLSLIIYSEITAQFDMIRTRTIRTTRVSRTIRRNKKKDYKLLSA